MAGYLTMHPTELQQATVKAGTLWIQWYTANSVLSLKDLEINKATSEHGEAAKRMNESNTIYRVNEANKKQPIRKWDKRYSRETSESYCSKAARNRKITQNPLIKLFNGKHFPAN